MDNVISKNKQHDCLAGRVNAIDYLKLDVIPRIIQQIKTRPDSKGIGAELNSWSKTVESLPGFTQGIIKWGVVKEFLEEEFPGCEETRRCIESYAANVPEGVNEGIYYDTYEQVLRTLIGMKVYLKTEWADTIIVNTINDKRKAVRYAARILKRYNTTERIFDLGYAREALGNTVRETGHTIGSAKAAYELTALIEKCRQVLEENPEYSEVVADYMELISETALNTRQAHKVIKEIRSTEECIHEASLSTFRYAG